MPKLRLVSAKEILARVIRGVGYKLPSIYYDDILEWLPEGLGMLQVTNTLITASTGDQGCPGEIITHNHCASLPVGFVSILAVEDSNGLRLPEGGDVTDITSQTSIRHLGIEASQPRTSVFEVNPYNHQTSDGTPTTAPGTSIPLYGSDVALANSTTSTKHYYKIQGNRIQTSFESGFIRMHYNAIPVCKDGYPLIPDNENFKQALEWHILRRLIGAGYEHKVFNYDYCDNQFEKYAARGMGEVSFPSPDTMARIHHSTVRLIPPYRFHSDFFVNSESDEILLK